MAIPEIKAADVVKKTLDSLAASPKVDLTKAAADAIKPEIVKEMTSVIMNQTNQEPWYQSVVTLSAYVGLATLVYGFGYDAIVNHTFPTPDEFPQRIGPLAGFVGVIYGRWFRAKPIGQ